MIKISGTIEKTFETTKHIQKNGEVFEKRLFWLHDKSDKFPNTYQMELWKSDCPMLDNYKEGDYVTVYIDLKGKKFIGKDGQDIVTNSLKCWNFEKDGISLKKIT